MKLLSLAIAVSLPLTALSAAVTLYTVGFPPVSTAQAIVPVSESITVTPIGTGSDGATTYVQEMVASVFIEQLNEQIVTQSGGVTTTFTSLITTTTTLATPTTLTETFVEDATHWSYHHDPVPTGYSPNDIAGIDMECTFDSSSGSGPGTCVEKIWEIEGTRTILDTITATGTGTLVPYYTLAEVAATTASPSTTGNSAAPGARYPKGTFTAWGLFTFGVFSAWILL